MVNQFGTEEQGDSYPVEVSLPVYKLIRRLETLSESCVVLLSLDNSGKLKSIRVIKSKEEVLS